MYENVAEVAKRAKEVSRQASTLDTKTKIRGLHFAAEALRQSKASILAENAKDMDAAKKRGMKQSLQDRLVLTEERIEEMAKGLCQIAQLENPIGEVLSMKVRPNGLCIGQKRVPIGVVGIIYESRPNVTADAFGLCFQTSNVALLRGGSDAICSNKAIVAAIKEGLRRADICEDWLLFIEDPSRETVHEIMRLHGLIDVLIPRGGAGLIAQVVEHSSVPVIETGTGNCHIYVDEWANLSKAVSIIENAKTQRMGVCNACESIVLHQAIAQECLPMLVDCLKVHGVEMRGDERACAIHSYLKEATNEDWGQEYLDAILSVKIVDSLDEAISHINTYNTGHSESIVTEHYEHARRFQEEIDAAVVYVNASTRFTDGVEFGFGAEIGISTQKLHARGPMGLLALTTTKYIVMGDGQIRS
jgi:glutamate-5-semialdehyde dehydrogenase